MMEEIGEAHETSVSSIQLPVARVLGQVYRQRAIRPEKSETVLQNSIREPPLAGLGACKFRSRELERWILPQAHPLFSRSARLPDPGQIGSHRFDRPQGGEQSPTPRLLIQRTKQLYAR
jgi:hypothetical protein